MKLFWLQKYRKLSNKNKNKEWNEIMQPTNGVKFVFFKKYYIIHF